MKLYRFKDISIISSKKPFNTHLWWEHATYGLILVDADDQTKLFISTDKADNWAEIDLSDNTNSYKIQSGWLDGNDLWLVMCDNDGTADDFEVCYIELDDSNDCNPVGVSAGADVNSVYAYDIFKISTNIFVVNKETRTNGGIIETLVIWDVDTAPFTEKDTITLEGASTFGDISFALVYGDNGYFLHEQIHIDGIDYNFYYYDQSAGSLVFLKFLDVFEAPDSRNLQSIAFDGSDMLYFIAKKTADGLNYLYTYSIGENSFTGFAIYNVALMLNRNCSGIKPNEKGKAFGVTNEIVYEERPKKGGIIQLQNCEDITDANIIAITDNFFMNNDGDMFEYTDIGSDIVHPLSFIECSVRDYHRCEFFFKGDWVPHRNDYIRLYDYYTSNGSTTADQIVFEGFIKTYDLLFPRKIWCDSRAKGDLDEFRPSGDYNGDLDSNHIKTLIAECSYITEGTIDATVGNTDNTFKGDKTFRTILNDWADKHYKHWYLSPTGALTFNDANVDSGVVLFHHKATYNFKDEADGTSGTDIGFVDSLAGTTPTTQIIASKEGHRKVIEHYDGRANHNFDANRTSGEVEFYTLNDDATQNHGIILLEDTTECLILKTAWGDQFKYHDGDDYQDVKAASDDTIYHHRVVWRADNTFDWYIDGTKEVDNQGITNNQVSGINKVQLYSGGATAKLYLDSFGELWDIDYNIGDNLKGQLFHCWNVKPKKHVDAINWVKLLGAIVAGTQISAESKDQSSIDQLGAKIYKDTYAFFKVVGQLQIAADNLRTREQLLPLAINLWSYEANRGLIQCEECVWFAWNRANPNISPRQVIINKIIYRFLSGHTNLQTTDGIAFKKDKEKALPQELSLLLQQ